MTESSFVVARVGVGWVLENWGKKQEGMIAKGIEEETSEGDGYIHYHNFGDGFMCIHICKSIKWYILNMCRFLLSQLYLNLKKIKNRSQNNDEKTFASNLQHRS